MKAKTPRVVAVVLFAAGAALLALSALSWARATRDVDTWNAMLEQRTDSLKTTRAELRDEGLRYQAFQKSLPAVPDSIRQANGGAIRDEGRMYDKRIRKLEFNEKDIQLDIIRATRKRAEAEAARKSHALPRAAAGVVVWACAALLVVVPRARRKPA